LLPKTPKPHKIINLELNNMLQFLVFLCSLTFAFYGPNS